MSRRRLIGDSSSFSHKNYKQKCGFTASSERKRSLILFDIQVQDPSFFFPETNRKKKKQHYVFFRGMLKQIRIVQIREHVFLEVLLENSNLFNIVKQSKNLGY
eukprot:TRINITY_DN46395_c0_g1_i2.p5 TRINITY_DN46395_c0_g1~~TRINITY_DN46395_c0_g1_i2.p5  ORF type:complete len:103 (-),score=3.95 TRINITY_DN46395_c0_g1_i2:567-875(-)